MLPPLVARPCRTKKVTKCWPNKKRDRYGLAYSSLSLCSYSIRIVFELVSLQPLDTHYFVPDVKGDVFCFIFVPHAHTFRTPQSTVTQASSRLVTCAECRHIAAPFVCPTIPNIKSNVGRNSNHHIVAFCNFVGPSCVNLFERSEFLIATCRKKKTDRLSVCLGVRLILVLVWKKLSWF